MESAIVGNGRDRTSAAYYATLFHELTHSTGHASRLDRITDENRYFGSHAYSKEELVAELGSSFLCRVAGIENVSTINDSAAYVRSWVRVLQGDSRFAVTAAGQAQKVTDLILGEVEQVEAEPAKSRVEVQEPRKPAYARPATVAFARSRTTAASGRCAPSCWAGRTGCSSDPKKGKRPTGLQPRRAA